MSLFILPIFVIGYVCMCVCMFVNPKKKVQNLFEKFFFSCKGMNRESNMGYIRSITHNAELQETRKPVKNLGFSDVRDCIVESNCVNSSKIGSIV